jgi:hypothetical protein
MNFNGIKIKFEFGERYHMFNIFNLFEDWQQDLDLLTSVKEARCEQTTSGINLIKYLTSKT